MNYYMQFPDDFNTNDLVSKTCMQKAIDDLFASSEFRSLRPN
jgi:hypothetical protein